ncbi:hypothetical protein L6252_03995, partial [Candidatus Parcubacteria bacterium]|nr:hypothetical protein [Candidatus Parcubacteria bacterium]
YGGDGPESYKTAIAEMASLGWSSGVKRIAVLWGDDRPHDCAIGTGEEPGLDGVSMVEVMGDLAAANVTTIFLHSGSYLAYWQGMAALAGGVAFKINGDGTVPGGTPIAEKIVELIEAEVATIDEVTLEVCDPAYADWLTSATPVYAGVEPPVTMGFGITITVPEGTEAGEYCFKVCLVGDGAVYATQEVCITVVTCIEVEIDNKLTPQTFNVQRGEKNSTVKLHINYSPMPIAAAMIVSVGGYDTLIVSGGGNGPLSFSSAEFSEVAALVVPEGAPRAENVSVVIVLEFEDGSFSCPIVGYLDIINEGGKK